jgi:hypothetical protein
LFASCLNVKLKLLSLGLEEEILITLWPKPSKKGINSIPIEPLAPVTAIIILYTPYYILTVRQ